VHKQWKRQTLNIQKTCEVYSLWFFEELLELIGISRGIHLDLSNGNSTTICGIFLIPRFLFVINNVSRSSFSNLFIERSWVPFCCWVSLFLAGFTSFGIKAQFLVQVCLSFNIFHSFVSSLAVHFIYLFLAEFPLPYLSIFVCFS
jgi:hypothetical protein